MTMRKGYLKCRIGPGLFKDERGVIIHVQGDEFITSFVDKGLVIPSEAAADEWEGKVRVFVDEGSLPQGKLVYLPGETSTGASALMVGPELVELA